MEILTEDLIEKELANNKKPFAYKEIKNYPINDLDHDTFEIFIYTLFKNVIQYPDKNKLNDLKNNFDKVHICKGTKDGGRDIILSRAGKNNGVVQCKRYNSLIDKPLAAKEIIKFCLNSLFNKEFIEEENFEYYFVTASSFTEPAKILLSDFNYRIFEEKNELGKWITQVLKENSIINSQYNEINDRSKLEETLKKIRISYIDKTILNQYIIFYEEIIIPLFFQVKVLVVQGEGQKKEKIDRASLILLYLDHLELELGSVYFDGLPSDNEMYTKVNIENLYVQLRFSFWKNDQKYPKFKAERKALSKAHNKKKGINIDFDFESLPLFNDLLDEEILNLSYNSVILGIPGSGKSMFLKHIAIAHAKNFRESINNSYKTIVFLPLLIRCRDFDFLNLENFTRLLYSTFSRTEKLFSYEREFKSLVDDYISEGKLLILIDGLDEISEPSMRSRFIIKLRQFMDAYPRIKFLITSRETGYRIIASSLVNHCYHFEIADFDDFQIKSLVSKWYSIIYGNSTERVYEAKALAKSISDYDRITKIAKNPLLLTTLLLVKRWVGQLPTKRSTLYDKAIEVLLMTWNIESYQILDKDQVLPQLSYLAYYMMESGEARIALNKLRKILQESRDAFPEIEYTISVSDFVEKIEMRSSLLVMAGYDYSNGLSEAIYEFRHLTFQEFLAAYAIKEGFLPQNLSLEKEKIIGKFLFQESWKETILLYNVLSGRESKKVINLILDNIENNINNKEKILPLLDLLFNSLFDEIHITKDLIENCLNQMLKYSDLMSGTKISKLVLINKYREAFENSLLKHLQDDHDYSHLLVSIFSDNFDELCTNKMFLNEWVTFILKALKVNDEKTNRTITLTLYDNFYAMSMSKFQENLKENIITEYFSYSLELIKNNIIDNIQLVQSIKALKFLTRLMIEAEFKITFDETLKIIYAKLESLNNSKSELFMLYIKAIAILPFSNNFTIDNSTKELLLFAKENLNSEDTYISRFSKLYLFLTNELKVIEVIPKKMDYFPEDSIFEKIFESYGKGQII
ncbi:NACHT domain-containing protein [Leptospira vanthielii]|uniref:NACHT domain-containing protein n=1 Tax=Leptospira vanthielii TaxID=293085 RepID=A0ABY2NPI4_9LEPT|nr:NACHT domain-containing protein [Leptospira vanthielii]TGM57257.1 NACHT domain-containing protein [Leptospira vanthielii]